MKVTVRVPASTSNLGPGYDSLGMALSLQAKFTFEPSDELVIEGCPEAYRNADNLVMQGFRMVCEKAGRPVPAVHLVIDSEVPVARGLGSSSTCNCRAQARPRCAENLRPISKSKTKRF